MNQSQRMLLAARAIASVMIEKHIVLLARVLAGIFLLLFFITLYLMFEVSVWWLLAALILSPWAFILIVISIVASLIAKGLRPRKLTRHEKKKIRRFTNDFILKYTAVKGVRLHPVALSLLIGWRYMKGRGKNSVKEIILEPIQDAKGLKDQFQEIIDLF